MPVPAHALLMARAASGSFDPTSISGCKLWLDASDASSFTYSSGVVVSQWNDLSGTGNHVTQATTSKQPSRTGTQNGLSVVAFDGGDLLSATPAATIGTTSATILSVFRKTGASINDTLPCLLNGSVDNGTGGQGRPIAGYLSYRYLFGSFWTYSVTNIATSTTWCVVASRARIDGDNKYFAEYKNGSLVEAESTLGVVYTWDLTHQRIAVGMLRDESRGFCGDIAEVLIYDSLSDGDRGTVEDYLMTKWGI